MLVTTNQKFCIDFSTNDVGETSIEIKINIDSETTYSKTIFIYSTKHKDFVSLVSKTEARRVYFNFLLDNKLVEESEYNKIVSGIEENNDVSELIDPKNIDFVDKETETKSTTPLHVNRPYETSKMFVLKKVHR